MKALITLMIVGAAATAHAQAIRHVPPADAESGKQIELVATAPDTTPKLVVQVRTRGTLPWTPLELVRREDSSWVAVVPPAMVVEPGVDYYIVAGDQVVFASPEWPHSLAVNAPPDAERRARDMVRSKGRRSRVQAMG